MRNIDINKLSQSYSVKKMGIEDVSIIFDFCKRNTQYYRYCGKDISLELVQQDLFIAPPTIPLEQKHYVGFYNEVNLIAIMDLIDGYPEDDCAYIGFFMMNYEMQGKNIGSQIISDTLSYLKSLGFSKCML